MGIIRILFSACLKTQAEYRVNFILKIILTSFTTFSDFLLLSFIFLTFKEIGGWNLGEIALIYSIVQIGMGIFDIFFYGLKNFEEFMISGDFDLFLTRPFSIFLQVSLRYFDLKKAGYCLQAILVGLMGMILLNLFNPEFILFFSYLSFCSSLLIIELNWILASITFWTIKNNEITVLAFYSTRYAATFPLTIFNPILKNILIFVIPLGTVAFLPLSYLLGKADNILFLFSPLIGISWFFILGFFLWQKGIKHYSSTGT